MQTSILSRYGIHRHSVKGQDYIFRNNDENDYRYENILLLSTTIMSVKRQTKMDGLHIRINDTYSWKLHCWGLS